MKRILALCATAAMALSAQTFTSLYSFTGLDDGDSPSAGLIQATDGNLYGASAGGAFGGGTVFAITPSGALTTIYSFCALSECADGEYPSGLIQATDGNLYGTTSAGGAFAGGTVFTMTLSGTLTTLYSFCALSDCADGQSPGAALVQGVSGNLYGTTTAGGANPGPDGTGGGTVFKITSGGTLTTLYSFCSRGAECTDGTAPSGLVQAANGDFYGAAHSFGAHFQGTIFSITPGGTLTTLHSFGSQSDDGSNPQGLVAAVGGELYGTTRLGGANSLGTVFSLTPSGTLTTLYSFCALSDCADGSKPQAALIQASDRNLYGTTYTGGVDDLDGAVFKITAGGTLTTLHHFDGKDGYMPDAPVVQDTNGSLYGTTQKGGPMGSGGYGTIFSLAIGLPPFVETQTTAGTVGAVVNILGSDLTGATSVTFNGTAAAFTVVSEYLITATVPTGATSGAVQVVTPTGTLSSNLPFRVL